MQTTLDDVLSFIEANYDDENAQKQINSKSWKHLSRIRKARKTLKQAGRENPDLPAQIVSKIARDKSLQEEAVQIANELWTQVKGRYTWKKKEGVEDWASDIEKIHRIDGFDYGTIRLVMLWSQQDDFWQQQIRSGKNLRKHFDSLCVKIKSLKDKSEKNEIIEA